MALVVVGDKIGIDAPTVGGSTDIWGGEQNSNTFLEIDEGLYAPREDRNLAIIGGGKIGWTASTGQVSFTGNIVAYNHITAFKNTITTAGSPVTLNTALKVGYVKITRKPGVDNSITSVSVAAAGALPNAITDADHGTLVLFFQTPDNTLYIPWARREILDGDHWQFGAAQSWYERLASSRKPGFKTNPADLSQLILSATATSPACVFIDGKIYANVANVTLDLDTAGRNGLDTGAKAAATIYYLYAIPAASGRTFDLVCSVTAPTTGPTGFSSWSYLGAFATYPGTTSIIPFTSVGGVYRTCGDYLDLVTQTGSVLNVAKTIRSPVTSKVVIGTCNYVCTGTAGSAGSISGDAIAAGSSWAEAVGQVVGLANECEISVAVATATTVYLFTSVAGNTTRLAVRGWIEDPCEWK